MRIPLDRHRLRTTSLKERQSAVRVSAFGSPHCLGDSVASFLEKMPEFLGARDLMALAHAVVEARSRGKVVLISMGAHVIKVGLSPIVIDLLNEGWVSAVATNGAGMVHDFEIACAGHTSEDVETALATGDFGMATETGGLLNELICKRVSAGEGLGEAVGRGLIDEDAAFAGHSILAASVKLGHPATVHVAIGTDVHHLHPAADGAFLGAGSYRDFIAFCERVAALEEGVYINLGSAVVLPEVFLKAVSLARNLGQSLGKIVTANMDFHQHYRPLNNVVRRPTAVGGKGYALTGHHEIMVPLLAAAIKERAAELGVEPATEPSA
jgi:hypothetical protein